MAESNASGEARVGDAVDEDPSSSDAQQGPPGSDAFNAFDANTWHFKPAPTPWYRTRQAVGTMIAAAIAVVALVISVVLLTVHGSSDDENVPTTDTSTAPASTAPASTTSAVPRPLVPPSASPPHPLGRQ